MAVLLLPQARGREPLGKGHRPPWENLPLSPLPTLKYNIGAEKGRIFPLKYNVGAEQGGVFPLKYNAGTDKGGVFPRAGF